MHLLKVARPALRLANCRACGPALTSPALRAMVARGNATAHAQASKQLLTMTEIDRLLKHISKETPAAMSSPQSMRSHTVPWMHDRNPDLEVSQGEAQEKTHKHPALTAEDSEALHSPRLMSESYTTFDLPIASDPELYDRYVNFSGGFRMGKLLEHLDSLAGAVAYRHVLGPLCAKHGRETNSAAFHNAASRAGLYIATASADRLDMFGRLNHDNVRDLRYSGFVTWTGSSSMEVFVKMEGTRLGDDESQTLMLGRFTMVCRNSETNTAFPISQLIVKTEEERLLFNFGEEHKKSRQKFVESALDRKPPNKEEAAEVHSLMLQVAKSTDGKLDGQEIVPMKNTQLQTVSLMFPQDRNLHGKVFGGILMRMAFELAFTNAAIFAHEPMHFLALDQITFRLPVPIGAVVFLSSKIIKTTQPTDGPAGEAKVHIRVRAEVEEVSTGRRRETNTFYFTMAANTMAPLNRVVVPETYAETMEYLEGQRRLEMGDEVRNLYQESGFKHFADSGPAPLGA